jgi:hypothetical protein
MLYLISTCTPVSLICTEVYLYICIILSWLCFSYLYCIKELQEGYDRKAKFMQSFLTPKVTRCNYKIKTYVYENQLNSMQTNK